MAAGLLVLMRLLKRLFTEYNSVISILGFLNYQLLESSNFTENRNTALFPVFFKTICSVIQDIVLQDIHGYIA